jgi:hypothetical protein
MDHVASASAQMQSASASNQSPLSLTIPTTPTTASPTEVLSWPTPPTSSPFSVGGVAILVGVSLLAIVLIGVFKIAISKPTTPPMLADPALVERCRPQLLTIYKELSPGDVPRVDEVLHHFLAMDNGMQELNNRLQTKYGRHIELNNNV